MRSFAEFVLQAKEISPNDWEITGDLLEYFGNSTSGVQGGEGEAPQFLLTAKFSSYALVFLLFHFSTPT